MLWAIVWVVPSKVTGSNGLPVATSARPSDQRRTSSAVASALEVGFGRHLDEASRGHQRTHGLALVPAVLQQQPARGRQVRRGVADDAADRVQPVVAGSERVGRFVAEVALVEVRIA